MKFKFLCSAGGTDHVFSESICALCGICEACSTGTLAGPIPGTLSNGERCDTCGVFANDSEARDALARHTSEPWEAFDIQDANAARIVACVNGCAGIANPEAVPDVVKVLESFLNLNESPWYCGTAYVTRDYADKDEALHSLARQTIARLRGEGGDR